MKMRLWHLNQVKIMLLVLILEDEIMNPVQENCSMVLKTDWA